MRDVPVVSGEDQDRNAPPRRTGILRSGRKDREFVDREDRDSEVRSGVDRDQAASVPAATEITGVST